MQLNRTLVDPGKVMSDAGKSGASSWSASIAKAARARWARLIDKAKELKRPIAAIAAVGALVGGLAGYWNAYRAVHEGLAPSAANVAALPANAGPLSIVVLPFANQTGDPQKAYIADGLTTSITADLSRIRDAFIVPVATAIAYRDKAAAVTQIGRELGVRYVLQGSVMADGNNVRINAQLADAQSGAQKWTETFDGNLSDLFGLQDQVTARIGNSLGTQLVVLAARESQTRKSGARATDLLLRANALMLNAQSLENWKAVEALQRQALAADSGNAHATNDLANSLLVQAWNFGGVLNADERQKLIAEGGALAQKARTMDPESPSVYSSLVMHAWFEGDTAGALRYAEKRVALDPRDPGAANDLAVIYYHLGEPAKAIDLLKHALALYPRGFDSLFGNMAISYFMLGDNASALTWVQKALDTNTGQSEIHSLLPIVYAQQGNERAAHAAAADARRRFPDLKAPVLSAQECVSETWCQFLRTQYLPAWQKAGLP
jgi:TolB-like protein/Flp pilus assembly protein TadD